MKFGHFCLPTYFADVDGSVGDFMRRFVELMVDSEELGFDFLMANEHPSQVLGWLELCRAYGAEPVLVPKPASGERPFSDFPACFGTWIEDSYGTYPLLE